MNTRVIAHRGLSSEAPENSKAAFDKAVAGEFFGVECDIWKTKDGIYVVSHDNNMQRMYSKDWDITESDYADVNEIPMTGGENVQQNPPQYIVPFAVYLSIVATDADMAPIIELKMDYTTVELREIVDLVKEAGLYQRAYFISLHQSVLLRLKDELHFPKERLQYVYGATTETKEKPIDSSLVVWLMDNQISIDARYTLMTQDVVRQLHHAGLQVNVWTVNERDVYEKMRDEYGVDYVTSNYMMRNEEEQEDK